jgi:putative heme iron utilization protein
VAERPDWLTDDVVSAVTAHMNGDHAEDNVVICRVAGERPDTTAATLVGLDGDAVEFRTDGPGGERLVRIPFSSPLADRAQIRAEVARMYHDSAAALGLPPRDH